MKREAEVNIASQTAGLERRQLDLVVPFTTPQLTRAALEQARQLAIGLNASIRVIRIQIVPYPMPIDQSPVYLGFLRKQMEQLRPGLDLHVDLRLAREFEAALTGALKGDSLIVLASPKRPWPTRVERLAKNLRAQGYTVCLT